MKYNEIDDFCKLQIEKLLKTNKTIKNIAKELEISIPTVYNYIKKTGLKFSPRKYQRQYYKDVPFTRFCRENHIRLRYVKNRMKTKGETLQQAIDFYVKKGTDFYEGKPIRKVAKENGVSLYLFKKRKAMGLTGADLVAPPETHKTKRFENYLNTLVEKIKNGDKLSIRKFKSMINDLNEFAKIDFLSKNEIIEFAMYKTKTKPTEKQIESLWSFVLHQDTYDINELWNKYISVDYNRYMWGYYE